MERMGERIRYVREHVRSYTQEWVADKLGIDQPSYCKIEKGLKRILPEQLAKLGEVLNWPVEDFKSSAPIVVHVDHGHGVNGYNVVQNQQQHLMDEGLVKMLTEQMAQVIRDQAELLKETQADRARMLELLAYWSQGQGNHEVRHSGPDPESRSAANVFRQFADESPLLSYSPARPC